jgi:hypothetical protein
MPASRVIPPPGSTNFFPGIGSKLRIKLPPQLMNLTRAELFALHRQIAEALALLPEGSPERITALATLRNIRRVLARCEFVPR